MLIMDIANANKALDYLERTAPLIRAHVKSLPTLDASCRTFAEIRALKDRAEALQKTFTAIEQTLAVEQIPLQMEATGTVSPYNHAVGSFTRTTRVSASIVKPMKDRAWDWLQRHGMGSLIIQTVNAATLGAAAGERMEKGLPDLPKDLFTTSVHSYVAFRAKKEKKNADLS